MICVTCEATCDNCGYQQRVTLGANRKKSDKGLYGRSAIANAEEHMMSMGWISDDYGTYCCTRCSEEAEGKRRTV